jgi:hypothetical protein
MLDACADINNIRARAESKKLTSGGIIRNRPRETAAFFVVKEEDDKRKHLRARQERRFKLYETRRAKNLRLLLKTTCSVL